MSLTRHYGHFDIQGDGLAKKIAMDWTSFRSSLDPYFENIKELTEYLYAGDTRSTSNANKGGEGSGWMHSTHTPILKHIRNNLTSQYMKNLFSSRDWMDLEDGTMEDQDLENIDKIKGYLETKHRLSGFETVVKEQLRNDLLTKGVLFGQVTWRDEKHIHPRTGELQQGYLGPELLRIRPEDIAFNIQATSFYNTHKIVRSIKTMGELLRDKEERPDLGYIDEAIEKAKKCRLHTKGGNKFSEDWRKHHQFNLDGFHAWEDYFNSGEVEILEFYGDLYDESSDTFYKNHVITVIDRLFVLRAEPLDTWSGRPHIFMSAWEPRMDNLWGQGPLEPLVGMQYMINHLRNGVADAIDQVLFPKWKKKGSVKMPENINMPNAVFAIDELEGDIEPLRPDTTFLTALPEINSLRAEMELYAGSPSETVGIRSPGEKTLGEVQMLSDNANAVFWDKIMDFERNYLTKVIQAELELASTYLNTTDSITMVGEDGTKEIMEIDRSDITTNGRVIAVGASHFIEKSKRIANLTAVLPLLAGVPSTMSHVSSISLAKHIEEALDIKDGSIVQAFIALEEQAEMEQKMDQLREDQQRELENRNIDDEL